MIAQHASNCSSGNQSGGVDLLAEQQHQQQQLGYDTPRESTHKKELGRQSNRRHYLGNRHHYHEQRDDTRERRHHVVYLK